MRTEMGRSRQSIHGQHVTARHKRKNLVAVGRCN